MWFVLAGQATHTTYTTLKLAQLKSKQMMMVGDAESIIPVQAFAGGNVP